MSCSSTSLTPTNSTHEISKLISEEPTADNETSTTTEAAANLSRINEIKFPEGAAAATLLLSTSHPSSSSASFLSSVTNQALAIDRNNNNNSSSSSSHLLSKSLVTTSINSSGSSSIINNNKRVSQHSTSSHSSEYDDNLEAFLETLTLNHIISEIKPSPSHLLDGHEIVFSEGKLNLLSISLFIKLLARVQKRETRFIMRHVTFF
jgi:hypothetical protein